jgi:hypothetical protein
MVPAVAEVIEIVDRLGADLSNDIAKPRFAGIKRQMPMILGIDHMRDQPPGGQSSPDQSLGNRVLQDDTMTGAAGQLWTAGDDDAILRRNGVEPLALIVTDRNRQKGSSWR